MHDVDDYPQARLTPGLLVYRYDAPLFFANARDFRLRALAAADAQGEGLRWFVLNVEANVEIDITALDAVEELRAELVGRGVVFALARVKQDLLSPLRAYGLADRIGPDRLFPTRPPPRRPTRTGNAPTRLTRSGSRARASRSGPRRAKRHGLGQDAPSGHDHAPRG